MKTSLTVAVVLLMAASAQAAVDAMNVNFNSSSILTGEQATPQTPSGVLATGWNDIVNMGPQGGGVWSSPSFAATPATALGVSAPTFYAMIENGGWGGGHLGAGPGAVGTLQEGAAYNDSGAAFGNPNHWNWYIQWDNLPAAFASAGYDVYALTDMDSNTQSWVKLNTAPLTTIGGQTSPHYVSYGTSAIQFVNVPEPATMSMLVLGGIATLIRRRNRR